ncbi:MAG: spore germination protein, partial [Bacilli bacterium]
MEQSLQSKQIPISKKLEENKKLLEEKLGIGVSFDVIYRDMRFAGRDFAIIYLNGFAKDNITTVILKELADLKREDLAPSPIEHLVKTFIPHIQVETVDTLDQLIGKLLTGQVAIMVDQTEKTILVDAKEYPSRTPQEPDTERVVRGSRDGFTETILTNTVLTRRRIRDPQLRMEIMQVGRRSKTYICIGYLKDVADPALVETIRKKLKQIQVDGLPMAEKSVEEFIVGKNWHPFPLVRYTERPDVAATHILEGHVIIYVDTSPSVMITPTTYFHDVQHAEEYRQNPVIGGY